MASKTSLKILHSRAVLFGGGGIGPGGGKVRYLLKNLV